MIRAGLAFDAEIPAFSKFDRKNYFYPDMPKDYQISQYDMPLTQGGVVRYWLEDGTMKECRLTRIHLEEDTGKSTHAGSRRRPHRRQQLFADRFQSRRRSADGVRLRAGYPQRRRSRWVSRGAETNVRAARRQRRQDGGRLAALRCQRLDPSRRRERIRHQDRDQEHELVSLGASRDRKRDRAPDRHPREPAGASFRRRAAGTKLRARRTRCAAKNRRTITATFPIRIWCRWKSIARLVDRIKPRFPILPPQRFERYTKEYGLDVKQATQLIDNPPLADYFDRRCRRKRQSAAEHELRAGRSLASWPTRRGTPVYRFAGERRASCRTDRAGRREDDQFEDRQRPVRAHVERAAARQRPSSRTRVWRKPAIPARSRSSSTR